MNWICLKFQLKTIRRDKLCILTFLLPIIVGIAINLLGDMNLTSTAEPSFGIVQNDLTKETVSWLQETGSVTVYDSTDALDIAIIDPSTQLLGVLSLGNEIRVLRSGDELQMYAVIADTLPLLYAVRNHAGKYEQTLLPPKNSNDILKPLLIVITMITAMFMGCTFNAMNILSEKEDGIVFINEILPMTGTQYVKQKIAVGFLGGVLSTVITAFVCMRLSVTQILPVLLFIILSSFIASLIGLFIGRSANGLMAGIMYIKIIMILFIAPPILFYLAAPAGGILHTLSYAFPSSATFYGLMGILNGNGALGTEIIVLIAHCFLWFLLYIMTSKRIQS